MGYFIGCKSKGLVLTKGLSWLKYREIIDAPEKVGELLCSNMEEVRMIRREAKNELAVLKVLADVMGDFDTQKINTALSFIGGMDGRRYSARALTEEELSILIRNPKTRAQIGEAFCM